MCVVFVVLCVRAPGAFAKVKESQKMSDEGKMEQDEADGIRKRCRTVGFALQAEMTHFHQRREVDFKDMMQAYLKEQIAFHQRVVQQLERTLRMYDNLWGSEVAVLDAKKKKTTTEKRSRRKEKSTKMWTFVFFKEKSGYFYGYERRGLFYFVSRLFSPNSGL